MTYLLYLATQRAYSLPVDSSICFCMYLVALCEVIVITELLLDCKAMVPKATCSNPSPDLDILYFSVFIWFFDTISNNEFELLSVHYTQFHQTVSNAVHKAIMRLKQGEVNYRIECKYYSTLLSTKLDLSEPES